MVGRAIGLALAAVALSTAAPSPPTPFPPPPTPAPPATSAPVQHGTVHVINTNWATALEVRGGVVVLLREPGLQFYDAQDVLNTPATLLGNLSLAYFSMSFTAAQDFACILSDRRLQVVDFRGADYVSQMPELRGEITGPFGTLLAVHGRYAYVSKGFSSVYVIDIGDPSTPVLVSEFSTQGTGYVIRMAAGDDYLFGHSSADWVEVTDVRDRSNMHYTSRFSAGRVKHMQLSGKYLYVASGDYGFLVCDVETVSNVRTVARILVGGATLYVHVEGSYAFLLDEKKLLRVYDVTDPSTPLEVAAYRTTNEPATMSLWNGLAFVKTARNGVEIIDVRQYVSPVTTPGPTPLVPPGGPTPGPAAPLPPAISSPSVLTYRTYFVVQRHGHNMALLAGDEGIGRVDLTNAQAPQMLTSLSVFGAVWRTAQSIAVTPDGRFAFVAHNSYGLSLLDFSLDPPVEVYTNTSSEVKVPAIVLDGDYLFLLDYSVISIIDISVISQPRVTASLKSYFSSSALCVQGDYLYAVSEHGDLTVFNIANKAVLSQVGRLVVSRTVAPKLMTDKTRVYARGDWVFATERRGVAVYNVANKAQPVEGRHLTIPHADVIGVEVSGNTAILVDRNSKLYVVDVSDLTNTRLVKTYALSAHFLCTAVTLVDGYAHVFQSVDSRMQIEVVDVRDSFPPETAAPTGAPPTPAPPTPAPPATQAPCSYPSTVVHFDTVAGFSETTPLTFGGEFYVRATVSLNSYSPWGRVFDFANGPRQDNVMITQIGTTGQLAFDVWRAGSQKHITCTTPVPVGQAFTVEAKVSRVGSSAVDGWAELYVNGVMCVSGAVFMPAHVVRTGNYIGRSHWNDPALDGTVSDFVLAKCPQLVAAPCSDATDVVKFASSADFSETTPLTFGGEFYIRATVSLNSYSPWGRVFDFANGPRQDNVMITQIGTTGQLAFDVWRAGSQKHITCTTPVPVGQAFTVEAKVSRVGSSAVDGWAELYVNGVMCVSGAVFMPAHVVRTGNYIGRSHWNDPALDGTVSDFVLAKCPQLVAAPCSDATDVVKFASSADFSETTPLTFGGEFYVRATVSLNSHSPWGRVFDFANGPGQDNVMITQIGTTGQLAFDVWRAGSQKHITCATPSPLGRPFVVEATISRTSATEGVGVLHIDGVECVRGTVFLPQLVQRTGNYIGHSHWVADAPLDGSVSDFAMSTCP